ncbi:MAG: hypothetical protein N2109_11845 [Fimbriimonadales bacterium]|nr:hypothetical protein [Fimbriimonadales bacterium]
MSRPQVSDPSADARPRAKPDGCGGLVGILVFLLGVGLLLYTFRLALDILAVSPREAIGLKSGEPADIVRSGQNFLGLVQNVLVLTLMAAVGGLVSARGVRLYGASRGCGD